MEPDQILMDEYYRCLKLLQLLIFSIISIIQGPLVLSMLLVLFFVPTASAFPEEMEFPHIGFQEFSQFILDNFNPTISLTSVLCMLFSITENPDLLTLHTRQQTTRFQGEHSTSVSAWIRCLAHLVQDKLSIDGSTLLKPSEEGPGVPNDQTITTLSIQLDAFAALLQLKPCDKNRRVKKKLKPVSYKKIKAVHIVCPVSFQCETQDCDPRSLQQATKPRDIPHVILIKGFTIYENCPVLTGKCTNCKTLYSADHERAPVGDESNKHTRVYLNSAKYLKVGQNIWVDRLFGNAVLCGMYNFHASAAAYTKFWNTAVWKMEARNSPKISHWQVWQTFVQESIRSIASSFALNLELEDGLPIDRITKEAFTILGERGIIQAAENHHCAECTQPYKSSADHISFYIPAATVGMDENTPVPALEVDTSHIQQAQSSQPGQNTGSTPSSSTSHADVRLVVLDGIVMGPNVWLYHF